MGRSRSRVSFARNRDTSTSKLDMKAPRRVAIQLADQVMVAGGSMVMEELFVGWFRGWERCRKRYGGVKEWCVWVNICEYKAAGSSCLAGFECEKKVN